MDLAYDRDGNIKRLEDRVFTAGRDVEYTMDALNRLTKAEEGTWSGGAITSRTRQELWTLDEVGNATVNKLDLNGNNNFGDTGDVFDARVLSNANELKTQDIDSAGGVDFTLAYDKDGQETDDGRYHKYVYDGFGRLKTINNQSNALVEEFTYDGLGHRISWHYDINNSGVTNGSDPTYKFAYDERWRLVASYRASDANPKEEFFFHAAGLDGFGGSSYIDSVILRDKDSNSGWRNAADGVLEQRYYYLQNWRNDTIAMVDSGNDQVEGDRWFAGGMSFGMFAGDVNGSGGVDSTDTAQIQTWITGSVYDVRADLDRDNDVDATDKTIATGNIGHTLGKGVASHSDVFNRKGYAGYELDSVASQESYHVRWRVYNAEIQRWNTRDPLGYVDGPNLYEYVRDNPFNAADPEGLDSTPPDERPCWETEPWGIPWDYPWVIFPQGESCADSSTNRKNCEICARLRYRDMVTFCSGLHRRHEECCDLSIESQCALICEIYPPGPSGEPDPATGVPGSGTGFCEACRAGQKIIHQGCYDLGNENYVGCQVEARTKLVYELQRCQRKFPHEPGGIPFFPPIIIPTKPFLPNENPVQIPDQDPVAVSSLPTYSFQPQ